MYIFEDKNFKDLFFLAFKQGDMAYERTYMSISLINFIIEKFFLNHLGPESNFVFFLMISAEE